MSVGKSLSLNYFFKLALMCLSFLFIDLFIEVIEHFNRMHLREFYRSLLFDIW